MSGLLISSEALDILRLITPEFMKLNDREMENIPAMIELYQLGLIEYDNDACGDLYVCLTSLASQFVPQYFN